MTEDRVNLRFLLNDSQSGGFPISVESIWCVKERYGFRVKNAPFFIDGISFDDLISVHLLDSGEVQLDQILEHSGNSTLWLNFPQPAFARHVLDLLHAVGCGIEGGIFPGYYSINVPESVVIDDVFHILDEEIDKGVVEVNYPSIRHGS